MKSIIETELPSSTGLLESGAESSEYKYEIGSYFGNELEEIVLKAYNKLTDTDKSYHSSLDELKKAMYCCDALIYHTEFEGNNPTLEKKDYFLTKQKMYRKELFNAIKYGNYSDDKVLTASDLRKLKINDDDILYIFRDFSVYEFTKALEDNEALIQAGIRNRSESNEDYLLDTRDNVYEGITLYMNCKEKEGFFELNKNNKTHIFNYDTI